ncbi:MAG: hypothetical protein JF599_13170 [Verrucomicrobia bacterium]|nr:hypothetical protein [Verrucomicrobiota bacterium]
MKNRLLTLSLLAGGLLCLHAPAVQAKASHPFGTHDEPVLPANTADSLVITPLTAEKLPPKIFHVGHVGETGQPKREALLAFFAVFQTQYAWDEARKIVPAAPWQASGLVDLTATITQEPANGVYLLGPDATRCVFLKTDEQNLTPVGATLHTLACKTGLQEWGDATGAVLKSPLYQPVVLPLPSRPDAPPRDAFLAALRAGQTFDILVQEAGPGASPSPAVYKLVW